jgi:lysophospholipase L1-like esterase
VNGMTFRSGNSGNPRSFSSASLALLVVAAIAFAPLTLVSGQLRTQEVTSSRSLVRRNIGRVLEKLRAGKAVTIGYLGGSITAGLGASDPAKTSYRALLTDWLRTRYPRSRISEINGGVSHTGSLYASMRTRRDVIAHKPDLVFIEFAVYDSLEREDVTKRAMEGTIRQLLTVSQPPEIVLVYATSPAKRSSVEWHESVASYYRLPSINLREKVWSLIDAGSASTSVLWKDGVNPSDEGHRLLAKLIGDFVIEQEKLPASELLKTLQPPFLSDELTYGELIAAAQLKHDANWKNESVNDKALPSNLLVADKPGAQFETTFEGTIVGLAYRAGPDGGTIECLIDGKPAPAPLDRIDTYDTTHHIATRIIPGGLGPGEHRLTIRVVPEKNAKSSANQIRLGYLLVGGQRPERL